MVFAVPVLSSVSGMVRVDTVGGEDVSLNGNYFGAVGDEAVVRAWYGPEWSMRKYEAIGCHISVSQVEITCQTQPGVGSGFYWDVEIDGVSLASPLGTETSYHPPAIETFAQVPQPDGCDAESNSTCEEAAWEADMYPEPSLAPTVGGALVQVRGRFFGPPGSDEVDLAVYRNVEQNSSFPFLALATSLDTRCCCVS
jgi:hypothetical protein